MAAGRGPRSVPSRGPVLIFCRPRAAAATSGRRETAMNKLIAGMVPLSLALATAGPGAREPAGFAAAPDVREWTVPWEGTRPRDPYVDGKGRVWFVGQEGNYVAYLEPKSGKFERYEIEAGTHPHNLVVAPDGMVWFTGNRNGRLVKLDPASRKLTSFPMPDPKVDD